MVALATMSIEEFCAAADTPEFIDRLRSNFPSVFPNSELSDPELRSWRNSLPALAALFRRQEKIPQGHILIEYPMPIGSSRADCILVGEGDAGPEIIVVELKQWTQGSVTLWSDAGTSWLRVGSSPPYTTIHPCEQASIYRSTLEHTLELGERKPTISTLAYLHNYDEAHSDELLRLDIYRPHTDGSLLLSKTVGEQAATHLLSRLRKASPVLKHLTSPQRRYSDSFIVNFSQKLNCSALFKATSGQVEAFRAIVPLIQDPGKKTCVIIRGLVGTGKTVLAMKLVQYLMQLGKNPKYYVKSAAIGQCIKDLEFASDGRADTQYLVVDEAHRLTKGKAGDLMKNKHVVVYFIDDCQWISPTETCRSADIEQAAHKQDFHLITHELEKQLRCGESKEYVDWVHDSVIQGSTPSYSGTTAFTVEVADSPQAMEADLRARATGNTTCRIVAGYCWDWKTESTPGIGADIHIGAWQARWNRKMAFKAWNLPLGYHEEIGAIYTVQGFEYDHVGVILGPDIVLRNGRIEINPACNADKRLSNTRAESAVREQVIRNIYYVLLTRAKKGVVLYAVDPALQAQLLTVHSRVHTLAT